MFFKPLDEIINTFDRYYSYAAVINNIDSEKPTVIVPDIHGRPDFVRKVFETYNTETWDIVFTGDILHREGNRKEWQAIESSFIPGNEGIMLPELNASLEAMYLIVDKILEAPDSVFLLRGNHDDVSCTLVGDFGKYCRAKESVLFREGLLWLCSYGLFQSTDKLCSKLPYVYLGKEFIASHTVPIGPISLRDVKINDPETHEAFAWSSNGDRPWLDETFKCLHPEAKLWFCGHVPVHSDFLRISRSGDKTIVQNNHPDFWCVVEVAGKEFRYQILE